MTDAEKIAALEAAALAAAMAPAAREGIGGMILDNVLGDNDPNSLNFGERVGSVLNKAGEALTFGLVGDEASAAVESLVPGVSYGDRRDHYRQQEQVLERDNPGLALGAEIAGGVLGAFAPGGAIGTLGRGANLASRIGASAAAGAGMAGTYGFMEGEGVEDRLAGAETGAKLGAGVGALVPAIGGAVQKVADTGAARNAIRRVVAAAPSSDDLRNMGSAFYNQVDDLGVTVRPEAARRTAADIADMLKREGADPILTPNSNRLGGVLSEAFEGQNTVPMSEMDRLRRIAGHAAGANPANRPDVRLASMARERIDDFVQNMDAADVDAGDIETLQDILPRAREVWARMSRSQMLDDAIDASENYVSGTASGLRNQFSRILKNPKLSRGFSKAELAVIRRVANGTIPEQIVRHLGGGIGMIAQMTAGAAMGGIPGALAGSAAAAGARKLSEALTRKNAEIARAVVASGQMPTMSVASETSRRVAEALLRRGTAATVQ